MFSKIDETWAQQDIDLWFSQLSSYANCNNRKGSDLFYARAHGFYIT